MTEAQKKAEELYYLFGKRNKAILHVRGIIDALKAANSDVYNDEDFMNVERKHICFWKKILKELEGWKQGY